MPDPDCTTYGSDYTYNAIRACCEWNKSAAVSGCGDLGNPVSGAPPGTPDLYTVVGNECKNTGVHEQSGVGPPLLLGAAWVLRGGDLASGGGSYIPPSVTLENRCQCTYNPSGPSLSTYKWDGCQCYKGSDGWCEGLPSDPDTRNCQVGCISLACYAAIGWGGPAPSQSVPAAGALVFRDSKWTRIRHQISGPDITETIRADCCAEVDLFTCPDHWIPQTNPVYATSAIGCLPECFTPTCPPGFTWDPGTSTCVGTDTFKINSHDRGPESLLGLALVDGNVLKVVRYGDTYPDPVVATITVEVTGVKSCCFGIMDSGIWVVVYVMTSGAVRLRTSRDQGRSWSVATTIAASGFDAVSHWLDSDEGAMVVALYVAGSSRWDFVVCEPNAAGTGFDISPVRTLVSNCKSTGDIRRTRSKIWEFSTIENGGAVKIVRARALPIDGSGTFS